MGVIPYDTFLRIWETAPYNTEIEFFFFNNEKSYMLIKYKENVSFARCGYLTGSGEYYYSSFQELYTATTVDQIRLAEIWDSIEVIIIDDSFVLPDDTDAFFEVYGEHKKS